MADLKHTPGPWKIDFGHPRGLPGGISQADDLRRPVTRFNAFARPATPEALANARLIAAAPTLLEALKPNVLREAAVYLETPGAPAGARECARALRQVAQLQADATALATTQQAQEQQG